MFEPAGDLGLQHEPGAALGVVGEVGPDLLEGDLAVQLGVLGHEHLAQAARGVLAEDVVRAVR